ncbi:MAG: SGNH/GDSL hydrolase family protein, partial [bacterium]
MNRTFSLLFFASQAVMMLIAGQGRADDSFLKEGDRWLFLGDSITHNDTYRQTVERVIRHFHPGITFESGNMGFNGATSGVKVSAQEKKPTVVSIMFGMNNSINSPWRYGQPMQPFLDSYRADMTAKAREFKALGASVILMTPTLTDEG